MKDCKRPQKNQESEFYQTSTDCCKEEIQRFCEFLKKLAHTVDKRTFFQCVGAMNSYVSGSLTYIDVNTRLVSVLRNHQGLLQEIHQLMSRDASPGRNSKKEKNQNPKSCVVNRIQSLVECTNVTPSYWIRPGYEEGSSSSSSSEVLNDKYFSVVRKTSRWKRCSPEDEKMNDLEDKLFKEDLLLSKLASAIKFGRNVLRNKELCEEPPVGFMDVVKLFYTGEKVPQILDTDPRLAVRSIWPRLLILEKKMRKAKEERMKQAYFN